MKFWRFLAIFSNGFNTAPWNLVYMHIVGTFRCVWKMAPVGQIVGPFLAQNRAKIGQYTDFRLFSWTVSAGFTWNLIYKLFCRCIKDRLRFMDHSGPPNETKLRFSNHSPDSSNELSDLHTTQTQASEIRWCARFSYHWMVTSMSA